MKTEEQIRREKLFKKLRKKIAKTCIEHDLLSEGDRILAGLSGGKDSYVLLEVLATLKKTLPFKIDLFAVHVSVKNAGFSISKDYMQKFCSELGVELYYKETAPDFNASEKKPCFICSWTRRKAMFDLGRKLNCNKLSFGHHRDDALETFMMNMLYHGSMSSLPYKLSMFDGRINLIRPMLDLWETDIEEYAALRGYLKEEKNCPWENETKRTFSREVLEKIEAASPRAKMNIFRAMGNIYEEYLPGPAKT